ncbi:MAG: glycoside hydrolase family 9 protein [Lachnospiraceae bacterium]
MRRMKKFTSALLVTAMTLSLVACGSKENTTQEPASTEEITQEVTEEVSEEVIEDDGNLLTNGDLSDGDKDFYIYTNGGLATMEVNNEEQLQVNITKVGGVEHGVQIYHDGFGLNKNAQYKISFDVSSTLERDFDMRFQLNGGDYHAYYVETVNAAPEMQHVEYTFTMEEDSDPAPRFCLNLGYTSSMEQAGIDKTQIEAHTVILDNFRLECTDDSNAETASVGVEPPKIKVNQLGYGTKAMKTVTFSDLKDKEFQVVNADTNEVAFEGEMSDAKHSEGADEDVCVGDFSKLQDEGTYKIVSNGEESYSFVISDDPYGDSFDAIVNMFYLQRCGMELTEGYAGTFCHPACHTGDATLYGSSKTIEATGGWHDAGDYGRYVVPGAKAVADLLLAYENNPKAFSDDMGIPESGNGVSDILDEAKYELDWMLKMQKDTGGVYHKVTCKVFPETVMPEEETDELIACTVSATASGDFAAVMAMASRVYGNCKDPELQKYGETCLEASKKAYSYLSENLKKSGFVNPSGVVTGEYPDGECIDEYFWAAAELYKTTNDKAYIEDIAEHLDEIENFSGFGWADVGGFGSYALLTSEGASKADKEVYKTVHDAFIEAADSVVTASKDNPYMINRDLAFEWGSNMGIANDGMMLILANEVEENDDYTAYAKHNLDYLLGMNATGYCFVTGVGTQYPEHPHHRPSQATGVCVPGMLVGGPNSNLEDPYAASVCKDMPAAKCYIDNDQSYSMNEVTIYWNSPLVYLMTASEE